MASYDLILLEDTQEETVVPSSTPSVLVDMPTSTSLVTLGVQGPPGVPGPQGDPGKDAEDDFSTDLVLIFNIAQL